MFLPQNLASSYHVTCVAKECDSKFPEVGIFVEKEVDTKSGSKKWGFSSTTEKCCKCKSGKVGWSASGKCSFCKGKVSKTASVSEECKKNSPKFIGNSKCAKACKSKVSGWSWIEKSAKGKAFVLQGERKAMKSAKWGSTTTEKCCKCKSGKTGWSASGRCSFCKGQVSKTASVSEECKKNSPKFIGNSKCAKACKSKVSGWSWIEKSAKGKAFVLQGERKAMKSAKWGSSTTEKCCKCKSGKMGWSASGKCSFCKGQVSKTASVSEECRTKSSKFIGNTKCVSVCKSKMQSSVWSWTQQHAKEHQFLHLDRNLL